jgi:hygromycin-B 7''-O-kinase
MNAHHLPADLDAAAFDALHDDLPAWRGVVEDLAAWQGCGPVRQMSEGTVLVALLGDEQALKLYPPFLRDHFDFECAALQRLGGRLSVPTPVLLQTGEHQGWPWLLMTQLRGELLTPIWPSLSEPRKCELLATLGALAAEVHALPVGSLAHKAPRWDDFLAAQRSRCHARQQRTGLPVHLLAQLETFLQGELPQGPAVILTGEYTPMNLLAQAGRLVGMFDFGDGLLGPREYDWLGPLTFLAAGHAARCRAFFEGYGAVPDTA